MAIKDVVVHLDQDGRTAVRLALATALARQHGARLVGIFAQSLPPRPALPWRPHGSWTGSRPPPGGTT